MIQLPKPDQVQRVEREGLRTTHIVGLLKTIPLINVVSKFPKDAEAAHTHHTALQISQRKPCQTGPQSPAQPFWLPHKKRGK